MRPQHNYHFVIKPYSFSHCSQNQRLTTKVIRNRTVFTRAMWSSAVGRLCQDITKQGLARTTLSTRSYAVNRAHVDQNQKFHLKSSPNLSEEEKAMLAELHGLSAHQHPLYVQPQPNGDCIVGGTITTHPPSDGQPVSKEHIPSKGIPLPAHETRATLQCGMPFAPANATAIPANLLDIGPEIAPTGSALEDELMKEAKHLLK